jgi:hypothetical protein
VTEEGQRLAHSAKDEGNFMRTRCSKGEKKIAVFLGNNIRFIAPVAKKAEACWSQISLIKKIT